MCEVNETQQYATFEESSDRIRDNYISSMNESITEKRFTCPSTLEQIWKEIENPVFNENAVKVAYRNSLRNGTHATFDNMLEISNVIPRVHIDIPENNTHQILRQPPCVFILGFVCNEECDVDVIIGLNRIFTKRCNKGMNFLTKDEVIPKCIISFQNVDIKTKKGAISEVIIANHIVDYSIFKHVADYYQSDDNTSLYLLDHGLVRVNNK